MSMRICGSGLANNAKREIADIKRLVDKGDYEEVAEANLGVVEMAIETLHDALLGVASGRITPTEVRDFFWHGKDLETAKYFDGVLKLSEPRKETPNA